jgi:hypothetical protein
MTVRKHVFDLVLGLHGIHRCEPFDRQLRERVKHFAALGGRKHRFDIRTHARQRSRRRGDDFGASLGR